MAIVRSEDGRFFDVDDTELEKHEIKPEDLPQQSAYARPQGGPGGPGGGQGPRGGGGGPMQLVFNLGGGGGAGAGGGPWQSQGPSSQGPVQRGGQGGQQGQAGNRGDVQAHSWCCFPGGGPWGNWHNWSNWNNWNNWNNFWHNCWHNCS